jgi:hypothetical protein
MAESPRGVLIGTKLANSFVNRSRRAFYSRKEFEADCSSRPGRRAIEPERNFSRTFLNSIFRAAAEKEEEKSPWAKMGGRSE